MLQMLIGPIIGAVSGYFSDKAKIKQAKVEGEVRLIQSASDNVSDWEQLHAKGSQSSWKDEWVLVLFSIPFILGFVDLSWMDGPGIVEAGFVAFDAAPDWYSYTFVTISLASFGIRMNDKIKGMMK